MKIVSVLVMTIISPLLAWLRVMSWGWHFCFVCLLLFKSRSWGSNISATTIMLKNEKKKKTNEMLYFVTLNLINSLWRESSDIWIAIWVVACHSLVGCGETSMCMINVYGFLLGQEID